MGNKRKAAAAEGLLKRIREIEKRLAAGAEVRAALNGLLKSISRLSACESVGIRWKAEEDYPYLLTRGFGYNFVIREGPLCSRDATGLILRHPNGTAQLACMCGAVIRGRTDPSQAFFTRGGSFWTSGTTALLRDTPPAAVAGIRTRNYCNEVGYESVALIPLRAGGETLGLLQLNSRAAGRFTQQQIEEYERIAAAIAAALTAITGGPSGLTDSLASREDP